MLDRAIRANNRQRWSDVQAPSLPTSAPTAITAAMTAQPSHVRGVHPIPTAFA